VTRSLLKRQIRSVVIGHAAALTDGLWVVRLRAPFDRATFVSAASDRLKHTARAELEQLLMSAAQRAAGR
jgi:ribonuclease P protein component